MRIESILKNKYLLLGLSLIIYTIFLILIIKLFFSEKSTVENIIKKSLIPDSGRGVFASKNYKKGDIVEECIVLLDYTGEINKTVIKDYNWGDTHNDKEVHIVPVTGKCNLLNHKDDFNVDTNYDLDKTIMTMTANRDIKKGEELYNTYGDGYWESRQKN